MFKELPLAALSVAATSRLIESMVTPGHDRCNASIEIRKGIGTHAPESSNTGHLCSDQPRVMGAVAGRDRPASSLPNVTSCEKSNTTTCGKSAPLASGTVAILFFSPTLFSPVFGVYRSRTKERSSTDRPCHGLVSPFVVPDLLHPLSEFAVVAVVPNP